MLKLMIAVIVLMTLCGRFYLCYGDKLKCDFNNFNCNFKDNPQYKDVYSCQVTSLDNSNIIDGYTGVHMANKNVSDVKSIWIHHTNTKLIPDDIGQLFNLIGLEISHSQLNEIRADNFLGMQELEYFILFNNSLTSVPSNTFSFLPKLKYIDLSYNQISEIPSGLFINNLNLEQIHLYGNKIKFLSSGVFDGLSKLNNVDLRDNICEINQQFEGTIEIVELKNEMNTKCKNPNDPHVIINKLKEEKKELIKDKDMLKKDNDALKKNYDALMKEKDGMKMELNKKTIEINDLTEKFETNCKHPIEAVEVKLNEVIGIKETINKLIKASEEHQKDRDEITKLKVELSTAKAGQDEDRKERDQLKKDLTDSKKELTEAKETIQQKLPKMEQTIEDFFLEVFELKIERHYKREDLIALRSKLMETKEQLAECKNE